MTEVEEIDENEEVEPIDVETIQFNPNLKGIHYVNSITDPERKKAYMDLVNFAAMSAQPRLSYKRLVLQPLDVFFKYVMKLTEKHPELNADFLALKRTGNSSQDGSITPKLKTSQ